MHRARDNEYQDPTSIGSLPGARGCWLALRAAGAHAIPQQFEFTFACPTLPVAHGLAAFLRDITCRPLTPRPRSTTRSRWTASRIATCNPWSISSTCSPRFAAWASATGRHSWDYV